MGPGAQPSTRRTVPKETLAKATLRRRGRGQALDSAERESFFRAIERHRRAAWRVRAVSLFANSTVAFIVAMLMAPLFYAMICLTFDLVNLVVPAPNLVTAIGSFYKAAASHPGSVQWARPLLFLFA